MTWVIGTATPFGYCFGISDVQVTFPDGSTFDCLQKIHAVGPYIAAGFSGSVAIGFEMMATLAHLLRPNAPNMAWIPTQVAKWWHADAQSVFNSFPESEKKLGCDLILFGVHPSKKENELGPRTEVYRFLSRNNFLPFRAKPLQVLSIGSGNSKKPYMTKLRQINRNIDPNLRLEAGRPAGMGRALMSSLTRVIQDNPKKGISHHLHICVVRLGEIELAPNDIRYINRPDLSDLVMPPVATNYTEFKAFFRKKGLTAEAACC